jgi:hypothetical protein
MSLSRETFESNGLETEVKVWHRDEDEEETVYLLSTPGDWAGEKPDLLGVFTSFPKVMEWLSENYELKKGYMGIMYWLLSEYEVAHASFSKLEVREVPLNEGIHT